MILQDYMHVIRNRTSFDEDMLPDRQIISELNLGWKRVCRELRVPEVCLHCNIVKNQALYTPSGFQENVLGVKKVTYKKIPLRMVTNYLELKDLEREADETGTPTKFAIEPRGEFPFTIRLNRTPDENVTDSATTAGLWMWVYVEIEPVLSLTSRPNGLTDDQADLGLWYALEEIYLAKSDVRARYAEKKAEKLLARLRLVREAPRVVQYFKFKL